MNEEQKPFSKFSPEEIKVLKAQIGAVLNYSSPGAWPEALGNEIRQKITPEDIAYLKTEIEKMLPKK